MKKIVLLILVLFCFSHALADEITDMLKKGNEYFSNKDFDKALNQYKEILQTDPSYAEAYYNMGLAFREKGSIQEAKDAFSKAQKLYALQNKGEWKRREAEKLFRSMDLLLRNQKRSGYLLIIFVPLFCISLFKLKKDGKQIYRINEVIGLSLIVIALLVSRFFPFFERLSFLWWSKTIIVAIGYLGGLFFILKSGYLRYKLKKRK